MKAAIWTRYGPPEVLQVRDVEKPIPQNDEVLIKVFATTVTAGDCELRRFKVANWIWLPLRLYMGIFRPRLKILGQELSGIVVKTGNDVSKFEVGDEVFAALGMTFGGYAQFKCLPESKVICKKPNNMSLLEAATVPTGGINALHFIRKAQLTKGEKVLIIGAGGSIGTYALQLAKLNGTHVTCVDKGFKLQMLTDLGSDEVIDFTTTDFTQLSDKYDVIIDIVCKNTYADMTKILKESGRLILGNPTFSSMMKSIWTNKTSKIKVITALAAESIEDFEHLKSLIEEGHLKSVIDRTFDLVEIVEAHQYVEDENKKGHLVIKIPHA